MANPQQPEAARSRKTPAQDPDSATAALETQGQPSGKGATGPVPAENQPGHHPEQEQDKPDLDAFAEKFGVADDDGQTSGEPAFAARADTGGATAQTPVPGQDVRPGGGAVMVIAASMAGLLLVVLGLRTRSRRRRRRSR